MTDTRIIWDPVQLIGDWILKGNVLDTDRELVTAVAVSLFSDALAYDDDRLPDEATRGQPWARRGVWMDHEAREIHDAPPIGGRVWLISREKQTEETRLRAERYCIEALAWLTDPRHRVAQSYTVAAYWFRPQMLGTEINIYRGGRDDIAVRFQPLWNQLFPAAAGVPTPAPPPVQPKRQFGPEFGREFG